MLIVFEDDNVNTLAAFLLMLYCSFSSLISSSIVRFSFYVLVAGFYLKLKGLSDVRVVSITKKQYGFSVHFL